MTYNPFDLFAPQSRLFGMDKALLYCTPEIDCVMGEFNPMTECNNEALAAITEYREGE